MANELDPKYGSTITLQFGQANVPANAVTDMKFSQGGAGFLVPAGHAFFPALLYSASNGAIAAGKITFQVIDNGSEIGGPVVELSSLAQAGSNIARFGAYAPVPAGHTISVSATASVDLAPATCDIDAVLVGYLVTA